MAREGLPQDSQKSSRGGGARTFLTRQLKKTSPLLDLIWIFDRTGWFGSGSFRGTLGLNSAVLPMRSFRDIHGTTANDIIPFLFTGGAVRNDWRQIRAQSPASVSGSRRDLSWCSAFSLGSFHTSSLSGQYSRRLLKGVVYDPLSDLQLMSELGPSLFSLEPNTCIIRH
jgi:hypothetical protein